MGVGSWELGVGRIRGQKKEGKRKEERRKREKSQYRTQAFLPTPNS
jgi:hypothetical protein